jgi:hypothetical protein
MRTNFGMPYVRLDEQNGHFGPFWVRLEFVIFVTFSCLASFLDRSPAVFGPFFAQTCAECLVLAI